MINNSEFADRLTSMMRFYQLSASAFADKIQVPRSSISHLLSGRNKPSLDFVLKVVKEFDEVELYWLLNGKGTFPMSETSSTAPEQMIQKPEIISPTVSEVSELDKNTLSKKIERIVIFYNDGTFKEYIK
jgi:plasmid maintenance system antidote protein VapI